MKNQVCPCCRDELTKLHILYYTIILFVVTLIPFVMGMSGLIYLVGAVLLGAGFLYYAVKMYRDYSDALAKTTFKFSINYLMLLFAALLVDHYFKIGIVL
jgi:protoheme IX farnesyltransferase